MNIVQDGLTFDDVLLLPRHSKVLPKNVQLKTYLTDQIVLNIPLVSAAMDSVTEARLAIGLAEEGGLGILHKNMDPAAQAKEVRRVKQFEGDMVKHPISVTPQTTLGELRNITKAHHISGVPVVADGALLGIVTSRDVRLETNLAKPVSEVMTPKERLVTIQEGASREIAVDLLRHHRIEKILVVNEDFHLRGMITVKDIMRTSEKPNACKDANGHLRVGAAIGVAQSDMERLDTLVEAGVDVIVIDTAHGHSEGVICQVRTVKQRYPHLPIIAGNIATKDAALALQAAGADAVKVGIGPGSICTTRIVTGVGVPQVTAIDNVVQALKGSRVRVIADGGIRYSGDVCKALAVGADAVMIGSLFAGTEEAPGEVELYQGRTYKAYRGMGSLGAMARRQGSSDRYFQDFSKDGIDKLVPEGIEGRVPYKGSLQWIVHQLLGGVRSAMGYLGCETIAELQTNAEFVKISSAGVRESHVHDVSITKEAPNYWVED